MRKDTRVIYVVACVKGWNVQPQFDMHFSMAEAKRRKSNCDKKCFACDNEGSHEIVRYFREARR